jgi:hypothetical protein
MEEIRTAWETLQGKSTGKRALERSTHRCKGSIEVCFKDRCQYAELD